MVARVEETEFFRKTRIVPNSPFVKPKFVGLWQWPQMGMVLMDQVKIGDNHTRLEAKQTVDLGEWDAAVFDEFLNTVKAARFPLLKELADFDLAVYPA